VLRFLVDRFGPVGRALQGGGHPSPHTSGAQTGPPVGSAWEPKRGHKRGPAAEEPALGAGPGAKRRKGRPPCPEARATGSLELLGEMPAAAGADAYVREGRGRSRGGATASAVRPAGVWCALERARYASPPQNN